MCGRYHFLTGKRKKVRSPDTFTIHRDDLKYIFNDFQARSELYKTTGCVIALPFRMEDNYLFCRGHWKAIRTVFADADPS